ncbi:unnamed protein product [Chironomus riparius]|uniref:BET1 homolog n=1 Tax=Chironomus riparius TaxID=315576 RepID=A0A9N9RVV0_9DIPT|nr:unnamed protein product [Chironomus riparius]
MMRRPQNYGYEPLAQNAGDLESENDRLAEELKGKISSLKSLTIDIGNEVRYQDKILNDMDDDMSRTGSFMGNTIGKVLRLSKRGKGYTCYMLLFALLVFFILYIYIKFR